MSGGKIMEIPYDLIHEIEFKYGTVDIPNDNPMMVKLHDIMGVVVKKHHNVKPKKYEFLPHHYDDEVINLINYGYSINETARKLGHATTTVSKIAKFYGISTKPKFIYKFNDVYLTAMSNLKYWGIKIYHVQGFKDERLSVERHYWGEIPDGGKYMLPENDKEIFIKEIQQNEQ